MIDTKTERFRRMRALVVEFIGSGLTRAAFCRREKIPLSTLDFWLRKVRGKKRPAGTVTDRQPLFIPLSSENPPRPDDRYELHFSDGRSLIIPLSVPIDDVLRLVRSGCRGT